MTTDAEKQIALERKFEDIRDRLSAALWDLHGIPDIMRDEKDDWEKETNEALMEALDALSRYDEYQEAKLAKVRAYIESLKAEISQKEGERGD